MLKTMQIGDKEVTFSTAFAWTFIYKSQFGKDPVKSLVPMLKSTFNDPEIEAIENEDEKSQAQVLAMLEELGFTGVIQIAWAMAKLVDNNISDPLTWLISFGDDFPVMDVMTELVTEAVTSCFATKNLSTPDPAETTKRKNQKK